METFPARVLCNHDDIVASRTLGKLFSKCEGCRRRKKWPWTKMSKCLQCKKLWHNLCVPSGIQPAVEDGGDTKADLLRIEDPIGVSAVKTRSDNRSRFCGDATTSLSVCKGLGNCDRDVENTAAVVDSDCRRTQDVICLLVEDKKSCIRTRYQDFVTSTLLLTLDSNPNIRKVAGQMFTELLSSNVLTVTDITRGIDEVLKEWNGYLMDYPHFFSYVATIVAPLLTLERVSFGFNDLKNACSYVRPNNSSALFTEVLRTILSCPENTTNVQNDVAARDFGDVLRTYDVWRGQSKYVPLDTFMPDNQINTYFKNDKLGVLLLTMSIYNITRMDDGNMWLYSGIHKWIKKNIGMNIVRDPEFVRSLTVAMAIECSNNDDSNVDFFDRDRATLIKNYVFIECDFTKTEIQAREFQCIRGINEISATLQEKHKSRDVEFWRSKLLRELRRINAISADSIDLYAM